MNQPSTSGIFQRHRKKTLAIILLISVLAVLTVGELSLRFVVGMGSPSLYYKDRAFGFRLQPNQNARGRFGADLSVNNLGLRADRDWDDAPENKVLFLGDSVTHGGNWISNRDLFTRVAVAKLSGFQGGNGGVPNWGVENVYGLVVDKDFRPAQTYVTTFIENDFYRGLEQGDEKPWIWYRSPRLALVEASNYVWYLYFQKPPQQRPKTPEETRADVELASEKLKAMDESLKSNGYLHLIFISPTREQVLGNQEKDPLVGELIEKHGVDAHYLLDDLADLSATTEERMSWFQDDCHLTQSGHRVWGELIGRHLAKHLVTGP